DAADAAHRAAPFDEGLSRGSGSPRRGSTCRRPTESWRWWGQPALLDSGGGSLARARVAARDIVRHYTRPSPSPREGSPFPSSPQRGEGAVRGWHDEPLRPTPGVPLPSPSAREGPPGRTTAGR